MIIKKLTSTVLSAVILLVGAGSSKPAGGEETLEVTVTAYTMREEETKEGDMGLTAWGDQLEPGMKAIAVSRDLIPMGLDHETPVKIEGLSGHYVVRDKMNRRWTEKIDIYMGTDVESAREWGKKEDVRIFWQVDDEAE